MTSGKSLERCWLVLDNHRELPRWQVRRSGMVGSFWERQGTETAALRGTSAWGSHVDLTGVWACAGPGDSCVVFYILPPRQRVTHHVHHTQTLSPGPAVGTVPGTVPSTGPGGDTPGPGQKENTF